MNRDLLGIAGGLTIAVSGVLPVRVDVGTGGTTPFEVAFLAGIPVIVAGVVIALVAIVDGTKRLERRLALPVVASAAAIALVSSVLTATSPYEPALAGPVMAVGGSSIAWGFVALAVGLALVGAWLAARAITSPATRVDQDDRSA